VRPRREQRHDGRLIDIAPVRTTAAHDEIELIAGEAVVAVRKEMQDEARER
jgi:hypothetical protein